MVDIECAGILLQLARHAIASQWTTATSTKPDAPWLHEPAATFVTLMQDGALRGCIGSLEARRALREDVHINARAAAFNDQRFVPLDRSELARTDIGISLLSPMLPLSISSEADALAQLQPGIDGIVFEYGYLRSTFLPQVWDQLSEPAQFLAHLKLKAGMPANFWSDDIRLSRYTVSKFSDKDWRRKDAQQRGEATRVLQ